MFEELFHAQEVPICAELRTKTKGFPNPVHVPLNPFSVDFDSHATAVGVYSHRALSRNGVTSLNSRVPISKVRYDWDNQLSTTSVDCLRQLSALQIELSGFECVTVVRAGFLFWAAKIRHVDLRSLCKVQRIHSGFVSQCMKLKSVNLSAMVNVTLIGNTFMAGCSDLSSIEFFQRHEDW